MPRTGMHVCISIMQQLEKLDYTKEIDKRTLNKIIGVVAGFSPTTIEKYFLLLIDLGLIKHKANEVFSINHAKLEDYKI